MSYPTVLVPVEDSAQSSRVLPYASHLAAAGHGRIVLMQAIVEPELKAHAEESLDRIAEEISNPSVLVDTTVVVGDAGRQILEVADQVKPDFLAMATDRRTDLDRWLNGSVVDWVLRHTSAPVCVVPPNCAPDWASDHSPRIVVPLDGSPYAEEALQPAAALARLLNADILLLRVADDSPGDGAAARAYLETVSTLLASQQVRTSSQVAAGDPASAIIESAADARVFLIAMATHGRTGLARLLAGSVATRVLQQATIPLVLVRPAGVRPASSVQVPEQSLLERQPFLILG